jgi:TNF receptor-associated protein 1
LKPGENMASLDEVLGRMAPNQKNIYYLSAPNRKLAEASPYFEAFKKKNVEVIFLYKTLDDFCMNNLRTFEGRSLVAAESDVIEDFIKEKTDTAGQLKESEAKELCEWMKKELSDIVSNVKVTSRLEGFPALVVDHESASLRRMMRMVNPHETADLSLPKQKLEINTNHKLIQKLDKIRNTPGQKDVAKRLARVIFDGALIQAGIVDDPRDMMPRYNRVLEDLLDMQASMIPDSQSENKAGQNADMNNK